MNGPRSVLLISGKDPCSTAGGHESYVRAHGLAAQRAGFEVHVFCVGRPGRTEPTPFGTVHRVAPPAGGRLPVWLHGRLLASSVVEHAGRRPGPPPQLIHGFAVWSAAATAAARRLERRGTRAIALASAYGTRAYEVGAMQRALGPHLGLGRRLYYRAWWRWIRAVDDRIERRGYIDADTVLVNYDSVEAILRRAYGTSFRVHRMPYAPASGFADGVRFEPPPLPPGRAPLIVATSRHDPRKGIDVLLRALAQLRARGVDFRACLVGPGTLLGAHRRLAATLELGDRVQLTGRVGEIEPYLAAGEVYVLPSLAEASGSVSVLEALRAGLPVVASACDGIPEDLEDDVDALLVAPGDATALADALARLLRDAELRRRLSAAGRAAYERRFSPQRLTDALAELYGSY